MFNVWDIIVHLRESDGDIWQVDGKTKKKASLGMKRYQRPMCNYFSIGVESRIGLGFDKHRTANAFCNKVWYGLEGMKKLCCTKSLRIKDVMDYVAHVDPTTG